MQMIFSPDDATKWAEFSGDFNSIHFNVAMAHLAGSEHLIVHGMLALLYIKQAVASNEKLLPTVSTQPWHQFKAIFRAPVPQNHSVSIDIGLKRETITFRLTNTDIECFRGSYTHIDAPDLINNSNAPAEFFINTNWAHQKFNAFFTSFPFVKNTWIFLDAIIFSEFLRNEFPKITRTTTEEKHDSPTQVMMEKVIVQMSHRVMFDAIKIQEIFHVGTPFPELGYSVKRTDRVSQEEGEFGSAQLNVIVDGCIIMQIEIGLISKEVTR